MGKSDFDLLTAASTRKKALKDIRKFARLRGWTITKVSLKKKKVLFDRRTLYNAKFSVKLRKR